MSLVVVGSVHGSPGATTTACGLAAAFASGGSRRVGLVEADADGGVLAARYRGLQADRTLVDLATAARRSVDDDEVDAIAQMMWAGVAVVVAPPSPEESSSALRAGSGRLAADLGAGDARWVVDVGRIRPDGPAAPFLRSADLVLVVCAPTFEQVAVAQPRVAELSRSGVAAGAVCVGDGAYPAAEVAGTLGVPLVGRVPWDPRAVTRLASGRVDDRRLRSSLWWRSVCGLAEAIFEPGDVSPVPSAAEQPAIGGGR